MPPPSGKACPAKTAQLDDVEPVRTPGRDAAAILVQLDRLKTGVPGGRRAGRRSGRAEGRHVPTGSRVWRVRASGWGLWWGVRPRVRLDAPRGTMTIERRAVLSFSSNPLFSLFFHLSLSRRESHRLWLFCRGVKGRKNRSW